MCCEECNHVYSVSSFWRKVFIDILCIASVYKWSQFLVCCYAGVLFWLIYKTTVCHGHRQLLQLWTSPQCSDWRTTGLTMPGIMSDGFYLQMKGWPRTWVSQMLKSGSNRLGSHEMDTWALAAIGLLPLPSWDHLDSLWIRLWCDVICLPYILLARVHGSIPRIWEVYFATGPDAVLHVDSPPLPLTFLSVFLVFWFLVFLGKWMYHFNFDFNSASWYW